MWSITALINIDQLKTGLYKIHQQIFGRQILAWLKKFLSAVSLEANRRSMQPKKCLSFLKFKFFSRLSSMVKKSLQKLMQQGQASINKEAPHTASIWIWMAKDQAYLLMVILVHTWLVEADTTISGHFLWAEMEIILFIYFYPPR